MAYVYNICNGMNHNIVPNINFPFVGPTADKYIRYLATYIHTSVSATYIEQTGYYSAGSAPDDTGFALLCMEMAQAHM